MKISKENKFYRESVGECVCQVYEIEADNWGEAKKIAFEEMKEGDRLAECPSSAIKTDEDYPDYHYIDKDACTEYTVLCKGTWATKEPSGAEYWESDAWFFDDAPETYFNSSGEEFTDWEEDQKEDQ